MGPLPAFNFLQNRSLGAQKYEYFKRSANTPSPSSKKLFLLHIKLEARCWKLEGKTQGREEAKT